jgi:histidyl-tRNA synthetase
MQYQAPKGVFDILPDENFETPSFQSSYLWNFVETVCRQVASSYNFKEIRTPIFEQTEVFTRSSGETSDIVSKEMYTFQDKGERSLTLRPEGTASVSRALLENQLLRKKSTQKLFYMGPFFRYDRPQAGRYRQFHQFGAEVFGIKDPQLDAEMIAMILDIFSQLKLKNLTVLINTIGDSQSREHYKKALIEYLLPYKEKLSKDSQQRLEKNPLRILDSKDKEDQKIVQTAPSMSQFLSEASRLHFETVCKTLKALEIPYVISDQLVRGLDYYNETVFEIIMKKESAQNTIGAGGRYDGLLEKLGGSDTPCFGFAFGIERALLMMIEQQVTKQSTDFPFIYFAPLDEEAKLVCLKWMHGLRKQFIPCEIHHKNFKIQKALEQAYQESATYAVICGKDEIENKTIKLKSLKDKSEQLISFESFNEKVIRLWNVKQ